MIYSEILNPKQVCLITSPLMFKLENSKLLEFDPEIERTFRRLRRERTEGKERLKMANNNQRPIWEYVITTTQSF